MLLYWSDQYWKYYGHKPLARIDGSICALLQQEYPRSFSARHTKSTPKIPDHASVALYEKRQVGHRKASQKAHRLAVIVQGRTSVARIGTCIHSSDVLSFGCKPVL
jgi:hypothetical protein